jgi:hypothetical protein
MPAKSLWPPCSIAVALTDIPRARPSPGSIENECPFHRCPLKPAGTEELCLFRRGSTNAECQLNATVLYSPNVWTHQRAGVASIRNGASADEAQGWILDAVSPPTHTAALTVPLIRSSTRAVRVHVGCRTYLRDEVLAAHRLCGVPRTLSDIYQDGVFGRNSRNYNTVPCLPNILYCPASLQMSAERPQLSTSRAGLD